MGVTIRTMAPDDYNGVAALWSRADGVGLSDADSREGVARFLERNPGLSLVALDGEDVVAAVLCGHDGRRGYISHLAVADPHRRRGLATGMIEHCISALREAGIDKCHLFVFHTNEGARTFWSETGWTERGELDVFSIFTGTGSE